MEKNRGGDCEGVCKMKRSEDFSILMSEIKISEHVEIQKNFEHCQNFQFWSYQKLLVSEDSQGDLR